MEQTITVFGMILHPNTSHILLVSSAEGWTLPHFTRERWELWSCVSDVNDAMRRQLGITPVTLRCHAIDTAGTETQLIYAIENIDPDWTPPAGCRWASYDDIRAASLLPPRLSEHVVSWFRWETSSDTRRVPWYQRGWARPAVAWIKEHVIRLGLQLTGSPQQRRTSQRSTVWEVPTADGSLFFKAIPPFFQHEIALTEYLAALFPDAIPHLLAVEYAQGWMLMANAGDLTLGQSANLDTWSAALHRYAEIQVELHRHVGPLAALGCPVMPPEQLGDRLIALLADRESSAPVDAEFQLTANEMMVLREQQQRIATIGQQLAQSPIPPSLDHGDFWSAQILQRSGHPVLIDWSDANITMPFVSLFKYLIPQEIEAVFPGNPDAVHKLRDAYFEPWEHFATRDELLGLYRQVQTIAPLHYAIYQAQYIQPQMEVRWEQANMIPYFFKRLASSIVLTDS